MDIGSLMTGMEIEAIARPKEGDTIEQLVEKLKAEGKEIVSVREDGVVILYKTQEVV